MTRLLILITMLLTHFAFGQEVKELDEKYIVKTKQLQDGVRTIEILELANSRLYWEVRDKIAHRIRPDSEDISKSLESKKFMPTEGEYFLKNNDQKFRFSVDKNGRFTGSGIFENNDFGEKEYWSIFFENGKISVADIKRDREGDLIRKVEANDTLFVTKFFNESTGKLEKKRVMKNGENWRNSTLTEYYENGSIKSENDGLNKTEKRYYENGKLKSFYNSKTSERIDYDQKGSKTQHSYPTEEDGWCQEYFENGLTTSKVCSNSKLSQKTKYYYKNGKLDYYEVEDSTKGEIQKYDKSKKLISTEKAIYIQAAPR